MAFDFPNSPTTGQTYSITGGPTYVYNGTAWVVLTPGNQFNRTVFTATAGQTTFSMNYVVGAIDVYRNGVKLVNTSDFTATNGTSIVLLNAATVGDTIEVISYPMITYSDAVKRTGDTMTGALALPSGGLNVGSGQLSVDTSGRVFAPNQPCFSATASGTTQTAGTLQFNSAQTNVGGNFNTSTYRFTAPVAGNYFFTVSTIGTTGGTTSVSLYKNGTRFSGIGWGGITSSAESGASINAVIPLAVGDYVTAYNNSSSYNAGYNNFSGFLIG